MDFTCKKCGEAWDQDPSEIIECPVCGEVIPRPAPPQAVTAMPATVQEPRPALTPSAPPPRPVSKPAPASAPAEDGVGERTTINVAMPPAATPPVGEHTTQIAGNGQEGFTPTPGPAGPSGGFSAPPPRTPRPAGASAPTAKVTGGGLAAEMQHMIGKTIGGYRIEGLLGVGGMGAVFLAHQISLDRKVALKLLPARFAQNAELLARFTREALSAAQLNHHNIVQVFDVGNEGETHYISMEFVRGDTLAGGVKKDGRLRIDDAAGFVLQAARGLHYAHERGIIHRDIKPGNLMLNELGVVKIADMGLAKMRGHHEKPQRVPDANASTATARAATPSGALDAELTMHDIAMGTPSYMAPEQARDASGVDARADQYSLGCTLYYLVTGHAPFSGNTAVELITKHQKEPPPPLEIHVQNVPPAFGGIVQKMLAKKPEDRYATLADVVHDLEAFLGVESDKGPYTPREQHLAVLDRELKSYYAVAAARTRRIAVAAFNFGIPILIVLAILLGQFSLASGLIGLGALTFLANFIVEGLRTRNYLFRRTRAVFFGMPPIGWVKFIGGAALAIAVLVVLRWHWTWLGFAPVGLGLAAAYQLGIIRPLRAQRAEPIARMQAMLRELRVRGLSEEALHDFVARFSGSDWEEFFEELYGYEAMIAARAKWATGEQPVKRHKFATWRDPLDRWLDGIEEGRRQKRERKQLAKVEAARLKAEGVTEQEAEKQAEVEATRIIKQDVARNFKEREKAAAEQMEVVRGRRKGSLLGRGFKVSCMLVGLLIAYAGASRMGFVPSLGGAPAALLARIGYGPSFIYALVTAVAGLALILSIFSHHVVNRTMIVIGALLVGFGPLLGTATQQAMLSGAMGLALGALLVVIGFVFNVLAMLGGKRF